MISLERKTPVYNQGNIVNVFQDFERFFLFFLFFFSPIEIRFDNICFNFEISVKLFWGSRIAADRSRATGAKRKKKWIGPLELITKSFFFLDLTVYQCMNYAFTNL